MFNKGILELVCTWTVKSCKGTTKNSIGRLMDILYLESNASYNRTFQMRMSVTQYLFDKMVYAIMTNQHLYVGKLFKI